MALKVLLADDQVAIRHGLHALLTMTLGADVVEADDGMAAVQLAATSSPDVIVMDLSMPRLDGLAATREIRSADGTAKVVVLSGHSDDRTVQACFDAGAMGYVLKDGAFNELAAAIDAVMADTVYVSPKLRYTPH